MSTIHPALRAASDTLSDIEALRTATENRHRMLTRSTEDKDGHIRGYGLDERDPIVALTAATLDALKEQEHLLTLQIQREVRKTPFRTWIKESKGVGEKQAARLLAALGDPYINESTGEVRTISQLWAYAGYAVDNGTARRPRKGMSQADLFKMGNPKVKMRSYLISVSCMKSPGGRYRGVYEMERAYQENAVTPDGKPLTAGHQHNRALRKVSKEILRDLWIASKEYHESLTTPEQKA